MVIGTENGGHENRKVIVDTDNDNDDDPPQGYNSEAPSEDMNMTLSISIDYFDYKKEDDDTSPRALTVWQPLRKWRRHLWYR